MIEEQPAVEFLALERFLNLRDVHRITSLAGASKNGFHFSGGGGADARLTTINPASETASAGYTASKISIPAMFQTTVIIVPAKIDAMAPDVVARRQKNTAMTAGVTA